MRIAILAVVVLLALDAIAAAQSPTAPAASPPPPVAVPAPAPQGVTRDDYIAKARDAAAKRAATRFDAMDADHDGILTAVEIAAYRAAHPRHKKTGTTN